jgi:hypothetical protein
MLPGRMCSALLLPYAIATVLDLLSDSKTHRNVSPVTHIKGN